MSQLVNGAEVTERHLVDEAEFLAAEFGEYVAVTIDEAGRFTGGTDVVMDLADLPAGHRWAYLCQGVEVTTGTHQS